MTNRDVDFPSAGHNVDDLGPRYLNNNVITNTVQAQRINKLNFGKCGIVIDLETGEVLIPAELPLTEAALEFWKAVEHVSGYRPPGFW